MFRYFSALAAALCICLCLSCQAAASETTDVAAHAMPAEPPTAVRNSVADKPVLLYRQHSAGSSTVISRGVSPACWILPLALSGCCIVGTVLIFYRAKRRSTAAPVHQNGPKDGDGPTQ